MKIRLVIILALAILAYSERSSAHAHQSVKAQGQTDSTAAASRQVTDAVERDSRQSRDHETVMVDLPFPSVDISPLVAEYLDLTSRQISAIEHLVSQERREIEPLMIRLQSTHEKLVAAADQGRSKETNILAAIEASILTKLIIKTTRTQARLHHVLTHEQQKKLEDINRLMQP